MLNQLLQRVWSRSDPANTLTRLSEQRDVAVDPVSDNHVLTLIQRMMGAGTTIEAVFSVRHTHAESAFNTYLRKQANRKTLALWHDGHEAIPLLQMDETTSAQRQPFGHGIHFTDRLAPSAKAASPKGFGWRSGQKQETVGILYEVHVGNQLQLIQHKPQAAPFGLLNTLDERYDSVLVRRPDGLPGDEFIVYNPAQCTLRYLVKMTL